MNKIKLSTIWALVGLITLAPTLLLFGQKDFSGVIVYNITFPDSKMDAQMLAMMPKTSTLTIKDKKSRTDINLGMGGSTIVIFDSEKKEGVTLMDLMGQKFAISMSEADMNKEIEKLNDLTVDATHDTKEIAGYLCKKAIIKTTDNGKEMSYEVYYTDALGPGAFNISNPIFKDISGVMLEYSFDQQGMKMLFSAISVEKKKVSDKDFEKPEGYRNVTQEELQNMFGGY